MLMTSSLQRPPSDDALFHSEVGALKFALNYQHGGMKRPSMTVMMGGGAGKKGRGLGGLDGAAQAGMISLELGEPVRPTPGAAGRALRDA
jgi:hypothetical protein